MSEKIRIAKALKALYPEFSQQQILRLLAEKAVLVNERPAKSHAWVMPSDVITLKPDAMLRTLKPNPDVACRLIKETPDLIFLHKDAFVHSVAHDFHETNSVANWLLSVDESLHKINPLECGLVHRLDYETSGVMVAARSELARLDLAAKFRAREVVKEYVCIVAKTLPPRIHTAFAGKHPKSSKRVVVQNEETAAIGAQIQTEILSSLPHPLGHLLRIRLITGYRHQIRAHLAFLGSPIVGDKIYGGEKAERLLLHAERLVVKDQSGHEHAVVSPQPF